VAVADRLVLTKSDLAQGDDGALRDRLTALNPSAPLIHADRGVIDPRGILEAGSFDQLPTWLDVAAAPDGEGHHHHHDDRIITYTIVREAPIRAVTLTLLLETLAEHCGSDLLRLKGIVNVAESPDRPAVIHGVQHVFHPPAWLARWPSADRRSRMVVIARGVPRRWLETLIDALDAEVAEVSAGR